MGNRVIVTIQDHDSMKQYYQHWNGGLDTWLPICHKLFEKSVVKISIVEELFRALNIKIEPQKDVVFGWIEENGHYFIDLEKKRIVVVTNRYGSDYNVIGIKRNIITHGEELAEYVRFVNDTYSIDFPKDRIMEYWDSFTQDTDKFI